MSINEFKGVSFYCKDSEYLVYEGVKVCPITNGDQFLSNYHFDRYEIWECAIALIGLYFMFRILAFLALWLLAKKKGTA